MKEYKFRWYGADGTINYRRVEVPSDAEIYIGRGKDGREIQFRWLGADGKTHYRFECLPFNAQINLGNDRAGREVWEGEIVVDDFGNSFFAQVIKSLDGWVSPHVRLPIEYLTKRTPHITGAPLDRKEVWKS
ncbi:MAG: hypothetical protein IKT98_06515 [Selenomonadaceae bacterium]|nr:hypothetical protein [Selenomonadaceae bacterium]